MRRETVSATEGGEAEEEEEEEEEERLSLKPCRRHAATYIMIYI
jgi:hypothetical protein